MAVIAVGRWASVSRRRHRLPRGLCLGGNTFHEPIRGKPTTVSNLSLAPKKAQVSVFPLSLYLGADGLTVFRIFDGLDLIRHRGPQIQAIPGHSYILPRLSLTTISPLKILFNSCLSVLQKNMRKCMLLFCL